MQAPFPWFGGKSRIASIVWQAFGTVDNYVEPFFGSGAVLLAAPRITPVETINDADGFVANFWRAVKADPEAVASYADWPVNENDLHARHIYLVNLREDFTRRLEGDPDYFDAKVAGWWVWGICAWIGSGWCSGTGPWQSVDGKLIHLGDRGQGINRKRIHLSNRGRGINRQCIHLSNRGRGINRQRIHLGDRGQGILEWCERLQTRLRDVRVCCGDWSRVCGPSPTTGQGLTAVFLDPPYKDERCPDLYAVDSQTIADDVAKWVIEHGDDNRMRIALCGYHGEHDLPSGWIMYAWKTEGGYGSQGSGRGRDNQHKERVWFSPHCLGAGQQKLFTED